MGGAHARGRGSTFIALSAVIVWQWPSDRLIMIRSKQSGEKRRNAGKRMKEKQFDIEVKMYSLNVVSFDFVIILAS